MGCALSRLSDQCRTRRARLGGCDLAELRQRGWNRTTHNLSRAIRRVSDESPEVQQRRDDHQLSCRRDEAAFVPPVEPQTEIATRGD